MIFLMPQSIAIIGGPLVLMCYITTTGYFGNITQKKAMFFFLYNDEAKLL